MGRPPDLVVGKAAAGRVPTIVTCLVQVSGQRHVIVAGHQGDCPMNAHLENRSTKRFSRHTRVDIRGHARSDWCAKGELIDFSEGGGGFFFAGADEKG
jgi:hypothetical protein